MKLQIKGNFNFQGFAVELKACTVTKNTARLSLKNLYP